MKLRHGVGLVGVLVAVVGVRAALADGGKVLIKDDFSGPALKEIWKQTYPKPPSRMRLKEGAVFMPYNVVWCVGTEPYSPADYPSGLSIAVDMRFTPTTMQNSRYAWKRTGAHNPFGFQSARAGHGGFYARLSLRDLDKDGKTDALIFETRTPGGQRQATPIPDYNPSTETKMHRFRIDWKADKTDVYFDGKLAAVHELAVKEPMWIVGRNESGCNQILDNFELRVLPE